LQFSISFQKRKKMQISGDFFHGQLLQNARQPHLQVMQVQATEMKSLPKHACQLSSKGPLAFLLHKAAQRDNNVALRTKGIYVLLVNVFFLKKTR